MRSTRRLALLLSTAGLCLPLAAQRTSEGGFHWADVNGDGLEDALIATGRGPVRLLLNPGVGDLVDATAGSGLDGLVLSNIVAWADVDRDGDIDLFAGTPGGPGRIFLGRGDGSFTEVTTGSGLESTGPLRAATFRDFDRDGLEDLELRTAARDELHRNLGAGVFEEVESAVATTENTAPRLAASPDALPTTTIEEPGTVSELIPSLRKRTAGGSISALRGETTGGGETEAMTHVGQVLGLRCAKTILDVATLGCLGVSSIPRVGFLYPLSSDLFIDGATGYVGLNTTTPIERLSIDGSVAFADGLDGIVFPPVGPGASPMVRMFASGSSNADRMVLGHSAAYPTWGLEYRDVGDTFAFKSASGDTLTVALSGRVGIERGVPLEVKDASGNVTVRLEGDGNQSTGLVALQNGAGEPGVELRADADGIAGGGEAVIFDSFGTEVIALTTDIRDEPSVEVRDPTGTTVASLTANPTGSLELSDATGGRRMTLRGDDGSQVSSLAMNHEGGVETVRIESGLDFSATSKAKLVLSDYTGEERALLESGDNLDATFTLRDPDGVDRVLIQGGRTGSISLYQPEIRLVGSGSSNGDIRLAPGRFDLYGPTSFGIHMAAAGGGLINLHDSQGVGKVTLHAGGTSAVNGSPLLALGGTALAHNIQVVDPGDAELLLEADSDNIGEDDQPVVILRQDGGTVETSLGFFDSGNAFTVRSEFDDDQRFELPLNGNGDWEFRKRDATTVNTRARIDQSGNLALDGTMSSPAADLAEYYPIAGAIEPGDVVAFTDQGLRLVRADAMGAARIAGVISSAPAVTMGLSHTDEELAGVAPPDFADAERFLGASREHRIDRLVLHEIQANGRAPLALAGRVPCKVTSENGPIRPGDLLTLSSTPGHACKATSPGPVIGAALEALEAGSGRIVAFVNLGWFVPEGERNAGGHARLIDGVAWIELPAALRASVGAGESIHIDLTPLGGPNDLWLARQDGAGFEVQGTERGGAFAWKASVTR